MATVHWLAGQAHHVSGIAVPTTHFYRRILLSTLRAICKYGVDEVTSHCRALFISVASVPGLPRSRLLFPLSFSFLLLPLLSVSLPAGILASYSELSLSAGEDTLREFLGRFREREKSVSKYSR